MKKLIILSICLVIILICGCEDFLDRQPHDYIAADDFYKNTTDIQGAVVGCYNSLQEIINLNTPHIKLDYCIHSNL